MTSSAAHTAPLSGPPHAAAQPPVTTAPRPRLETLDGLRGLAVLAVLLLHTGLFAWGWIGVDVFFALSGFLITGILLDAKAAGGSGWASYGKPFYARRALRILPVAYATIALVFVVWPRLGLADPTSRREQLWYWLFLSNWYPWARSEAAWAISHLWSLSVEEQFYLVWPWVVLATSRRRLATIAGALFLLSPAVRLAIALAPLPPPVGHTYETLTFARLDGLSAGALVAALVRDGPLSRRWIVTLLAMGAALFVGAMQLTESVSYVLRYSGIGLTAGALVAWLVTTNGPALLRVAPLRWLGMVSYSVYVIHPFLIHAITKHLGTPPGAELFALAATGTLALAALSWYAFEAPIMARKRRWPMPQQSTVGRRPTGETGA